MYAGRSPRTRIHLENHTIIWWGVPERPLKPAPVGIHLHAWGANMDSGYGWWFNAEQGSDPAGTQPGPVRLVDWLITNATTPRTANTSEAAWKQGVIRPYTERRVLGFLEWMKTKIQRRQPARLLCWRVHGRVGRPDARDPSPRPDILGGVVGRRTLAFQISALHFFIRNGIRKTRMEPQVRGWVVSVGTL